MNIANIAFNADGSIAVTDSTGTVTTFTNTAPIVQPTDVEVDITRTDGTVQKFVPAPVTE